MFLYATYIQLESITAAEQTVNIDTKIQIDLPQAKLENLCTVRKEVKKK